MSNLFVDFQIKLENSRGMFRYTLNVVFPVSFNVCLVE